MCSTGIIDVLILMGNYWCAYYDGSEPAVICMPFNSTLLHEFDVWFIHGMLEWVKEHVSLWIHVTGPGIEKLKLSTAKTFFGVLWKHVMGFGIENLKLSTVKWGFMEACNGIWDWQPMTECSRVRFFFILWKHVMGLGIEKLKLSTVKWGIL